MSARKCLRCGHQWESRVLKRPASCPACKSYKWDIDPDKKIGLSGEAAKDFLEDILDRDAEGQKIKAEVPDEWEGWSEERQTKDYERGEIVTYRVQEKTGKKQIIRRESSFD